VPGAFKKKGSHKNGVFSKGAPKISREITPILEVSTQANGAWSAGGNMCEHPHFCYGGCNQRASKGGGQKMGMGAAGEKKNL